MEVESAKKEVDSPKEKVESAAHPSILLSYLAMFLTSAALSICLCVPLGQTFLSQGGFLRARNKTFLCTAHSDERHASLQLCCWVGQSRGIPYRSLICTLQSPLHIKTGFFTTRQTAVLCLEIHHKTDKTKLDMIYSCGSSPSRKQSERPETASVTIGSTYFEAKCSYSGHVSRADACTLKGANPTTGRHRITEYSMDLLAS